MGQENTEGKPVKSILYGDLPEKFEAIKTDRGIISDAEIIRVLVVEEHKRIKAREAKN